METNFKVDVPSFALGYSAGKKKGGSGGGAELNIAYGDTAPEDTTKLWVKTDGADGVIIRAGKEWENGIKPETMTEVSNANAADEGGVCILWPYMYYIGGFSSSNRYRMGRYNFETLKYESSFVPSVPFEGGYQAVGVVGTKIYMIGQSYAVGYDQGSYVYDTETNEFATIADNRLYYSGAYRELACCGGVVNGTNIHVIGGKYGNKYSDQVPCHRVYNPATNSFTSLPDMPTKRAYAGCTIADGYIYIVGGYVNSNTPSKDVYRYSIENKTYEQLPVNLSNGLLRPGVCVYNGKLYIFGGMNGIVTDSTGYPQIYCYDLDTEETTIQECQVPANSCALAYLMGDEILVVPDGGGRPRWYSPEIGSTKLNKNFVEIISNNPDIALPIMVDNNTIIETTVGNVYKGNEQNRAEPVEAYVYRKNKWVSTTQ